MPWVARAFVHRRPGILQKLRLLLCGLGVNQKPQESDDSACNSIEDVFFVVNGQNVVPQSGTETFNVTINKPPTDLKTANVTFSDQNPSYEYQVGNTMDPTRGTTDMSDASLGEFFARPVKIATYSWAIGQPLFEEFNPWTLFFTNPRVINRISNFNLLRCKLNVKIVINGNGFHYGRALASYQPLHILDEFTIDRPFFTQDIVAASQRPHIYIDPTTSQGGTLELPFFWYRANLNIPNTEWINMGRMFIQSLNALKHANGATDSVTVSVFAWASEVTLSQPTASNPGSISPQSGMESDEYGTGPVSKPASIVERISGMLTRAPIIGPFARASEIAAGAVKNIAMMAGYCRPAVVADVVPYRPAYLGNMANVNVPDSCSKLSLDIKQETTVDPRTTGLSDVDEMEIAPYAMRESYLTQFSWAIADTSEKLLWNAYVSPIQYALQTAGAENEIHMTPMCHAVAPFAFWRGTMKYRFQIVASSFHKGRIKVVYDPHFPVTNEYNTNYTYVLDIAENKDFTIEVGWGNANNYCRAFGISDAVERFSDTVLGSTQSSFSNGIITVYVVNELTTPNSTANNDISVNVFVSACPDFEVAGPSEGNIQNLVWNLPPTVVAQGAIEPQSGIESAPMVADSENTDMPSTPIAEETTQTLGSTPLEQSDPTPSIYFGEDIRSFRQLLKRYCYFSTRTQNATGFLVNIWYNPKFPYYRGAAPGAVNTVSTNPYNVCKMTLLNWIVPAYVGWRGGIRYKCIISGDTDPGSGERALYVRRHQSFPVNTPYGSSISTIDASTEDASVLQLVNAKPATVQGAHGTYQQGNSVLEFDLPYYRQERFLYAKKKNYTANTTGSTTFGVEMTSNHDALGQITAIDYHVAASDDFNCFFFGGVPVCWFVGDTD